ncbi:hypothetical protein BKA69DRAFT_1073365 [Paraphysoderma sedebokerense]|nr:hypothetical protein BKA69DRAFT_1073365 [Paraphysoderma sedebokerense]
MREHILHNYHELSVFLANISIVFVFSTLFVLFGGYIFIKTPSSKRHKTSFILGIAVLW